MNYWFDLSSKELYNNSERLNSDVCFFISKSSNEVHSGIHIYSDNLRDNNLRNILLDGEIISANITDDYYKLEKINELDTDNYLLLKHKIKDQNDKEFDFYLLYTHLLPANYYKFKKEQEKDEYEFNDKVTKDSIDKYMVFEHSYPFYVIPKIKLLKGTDIDIVGTNIVKGYVGKAKITNSKNVLNYIVCNVKGESFNPATVDCLMNEQKIKLSDIQCNGKPETIKIKKDASIYNLNHHKFAKLDKDYNFKFIDYNSSKKRVKVKILGKRITEIEDGYILAKEKEQNVVLCRKIPGEIYATIAETDKEKPYPPQERLRTFLQNYYPLTEISSEDKSIKENVIEIDEDVISKLDETKQCKIKDVLKNYSIESKEKKYVLINKKSIENIVDRLKTTNKDCNLFYYDKDSKVKKIEIEDSFNQIRDKLNNIEKDAWELTNKDIKFYVSHFIENEGIGTLLNYKVISLEKKDKNNICKAKLYISNDIEEEVYIDEDDIIEISASATVIGSTSKKKGLVCYKNDIPDSILNENEVINLVNTESFNTFYNSYKEILKNDTAEKIEIQKGGNFYTINIDKNINLEFSVQIDKNNLLKKVQTDTIFGHLAKQSDRKYVDIALFTFDKADLKWFQWKIPSGSQLFKTVLQKDDGKKLFLSNSSVINLKASADYSGFSQIESVVMRVCIYMNIESENKTVNKLLDTSVKEFTCYLGFAEFEYKNGTTTCKKPEKVSGADTSLVCDLLTTFFSGKERKIYNIRKTKDNAGDDYWIFSFTNSDYFNKKKFFIENVKDSSITISNNEYPQIYEKLSYKDEGYCNLETDLYLDKEPKSNKGKYYFDYNNTNCFLKEKTFNKVDRLKMSELFHTVKIDDKGQLYTSNYEIFDIFENTVKIFKTNILLQLTYPCSKELLKSIRYATVQKPLEFDKEKKNDEFVKALNHAGFTAIKDDKKDYWSKIKEQAANYFTGENCFWFYHPVTFLDALDSMGILNIHAKELFEIQQLVVHLNNLRPHSTNNPVGGVRGDQYGTFCNQAVFITIRALDKNFKNFTAGINDVPYWLDKYKNDERWLDYKEQYPELWISNFWCDILEYQANHEKTTGIKLISKEKAQQLANLGYVVIAAWKNIDKPFKGVCHPHYATVAPSKLLSGFQDLIIANVGNTCQFCNLTDAFHYNDIDIKFFYDENQDFIKDLNIGDKTNPSIQDMIKDYGVWSATNDKWTQTL